MTEIVENGVSNGHLDSVEQESTPQVALEQEIPKMKQAELKLTDYMKKSLDHVAANEGFKNYTINLDHGSGIGDGFVGVVVRATIQEIDSDKKLRVIVKIPPENEARREQFKSMQMFEREIYAYNTILPKFVEFQLENGVGLQDGFFNFPKIYFAEHDKELDDAIIIMEDLKVEGYQMFSKFKPIDFEHARLVMSYLAKLHALSFAFKKANPEIYKIFEKELETDFFAMQFEDERFVGMVQMMMGKALGTLDPDDKRNQMKMANFMGNLTSFIGSLKNNDKMEPYSVLIHGDCWTNNFMFQYKVSPTTRFFLKFTDFS